MIKVGICGLGAIGMKLARALDEGVVDGMRLSAVSARDLDAARTRMAELSSPPQVVPAERLAELAEVVVECAPAAVFDTVARATIEAGRILMPLSVGALLDRMELVDRARETGARIVVPTGAILGLDAVRAMAEGEISSVTLTTRKPPQGLAGAPYLVDEGIEIDGLTEPKLVFRGTAREAARGFPANVNVSAALSLAGIGPDRTSAEIWADPGVDRNIQSVRIVSDSAEAEMTIRNIPSAENPRTGRITALSVLACLRRMTAPLVSGS